MKLAAGDFVVYGTHGVGRVISREKKRALRARVEYDARDGAEIPIDVQPV